MAEDLVLLITQYGVLVVFANVLLEQIGLPIPAIPTLVVAGALAADGKLPTAELFVVALIACAIADGVWYAAGRIYGSRVMKTLCRMSLTPDSCVSDTQARFERWGVNALLVAKFVPGLAIIAPPLAGATRIPLPRFLWFNTLGGALWVGVGLGVGMLFKSQIEHALTQLGNAGSWVLAIVAACFALYIAYKWWERRRFFAALRMARIDVDELYRLMDGKPAPVVVDVRSATARSVEPRQIPGSLHVPLDALDRHVGHLPRDRDIVVYCTCPNEASAAQVAKLLMNQGFTRVRPLHGGLDAWIAAGYSFEPLETLGVGNQRPIR
jgi:membrane protein DedA with SNARE-associated domain/rhodanese-related sulfurtransferase